MKHLITIGLLLFSFCSFGQKVDSTNMRYDFDPSKWRRMPKIESFNTLNIDSLKKKNPAAYNNLMKLMDRDTIPICKHIYVAVEQKELTVTYPHIQTGSFMPLSGKHEGIEIVCVKCFHLTKQIKDYGEGPPWLLK